jgi:5-methylthioadenosine/S-adenosylhomocysteine deaminase
VKNAWILPKLTKCQVRRNDMHSILIKNGFIATMDQHRTVYRQGDLYVEKGRIGALGTDVTTPPDPPIVIDARHKVVLPGFVNCHAHLQQYFRGIYELIGEFFTVNLPLEGYRRPEDMEKLGLASCAEFIYGGCTTTMLLYTYPYEFADAVNKTGLRAILGADIEEVSLEKLMQGVYQYLPEKGAAAFQRAEELYNDWHGQADGRITTVMVPKAPDLATADTYLKCKRFADAHGLPITTHLSQNWREDQQVKKVYGKTPTRHLHDLGLLGPDLSAAHCAYITEKDTQLIAQSGVAILQCLMPHTPLSRWLDLGIPVGLGTDDYYHDMFQLIRRNIANQTHRARVAGGADEMTAADRRLTRPSYYEYLELATRRGAEVLGLGDEVGSLEVGKKADIITVDMANPYLAPTKEPLTSVVLYGSAADIDHVIVDGQLLKKEGRLTTIDMPRALETAQEKVDEIIEHFLRDHPDQREAWERMVPYMKH